MRAFVVSAALVLVAGSATAQQRPYGSPYGNGNTYNSYGSGYQGHNSNTGSNWNAQSYGSQTYGQDSRGNNWSYDRNSGSYQNYGTGERRQNGRRY
jgi:hypothetical protein